MKFHFLFLFSTYFAKKPNVILLITDDFGIGDFSIYNKNSKVKTPNIDRLGTEGVKFTDAHAGSSRCSPSRYMLMTGRYSMEDSPARKLEFGTPHMGEMFKRSGYHTAILGKYQPLFSQLVNTNLTHQERSQQQRNLQAYNKANFGTSGATGYQPWMERGMFNTPGIYELKIGPQNQSYDYSFTSSSLCCQPGGYYENGKGIEPVSEYFIQRPYPEEKQKATSLTADGKCIDYPISGYMGAPGFKEYPTGDFPRLHCNFPLVQLAMPSYDSRTIDDVIVPKALNYIRQRALNNEPFFMYYGMRSGHRPFNTPIRFRNKTAAGMVGEMILEADEIVGRIMAELEEHNILDDTIILFMSDNGADGSVIRLRNDFGHDQSGMEINGKSVSLRGQKNLNYEAGHRVPFLWRWPKMWTPKVVEDPNMPVSYLDIYRTLADIIGADLECNEAPDSRSILTLLNGEEPTEQLKRSKILTHAKKGARVGFRKRNMKWIPEYNELYNLEKDVEEKENLFQFDWGRSLAKEINSTLNEIMDFITHREEITEKGKLKNCPVSRYLMG